MSACSALRRRLFAAPTLDRMLAKDRQTIGPAGIALSRAALLGIAAVFFLMGAQGAAYGPLLLPLTRRFSIDLPTAGASISANFAGGLIAVTAGLGLLSRVAARPFVWGALGLTALGALAVALAPAWPLVLGGVAVAGTGLGALDIGLTNIVAHSRGTRNSARLNLVNGAYGLGAVTGPLLVTLAGGDLLPLFGGGRWWRWRWCRPWPGSGAGCPTNPRPAVRVGACSYCSSWPPLSSMSGWSGASAAGCPRTWCTWAIPRPPPRS